MPKDFLVAVFAEQESVVRAVRAIRSEGFRIHDVYAPYPIHGLDDAMGIRKTRLPWVTLAGGLGGLLFALFLQFYVAVLDWPMNIGGKPNNSTLAFVPISFELTVLVGGLSTVAALLLRARLFPGARERFVAEGITDDKFAVVLRKRNSNFDSLQARRILKENGAFKIHDSEVLN